MNVHDLPLEHRYVAWFDILGMTEAMLTNPRRALDLLQRFNRARFDANERRIVISDDDPEVMPERLTAQAFSDSLFIVSVAAEEDDLFSIIVRSSLLFDAAIVHRVPVRAAITVGPVVVDPDWDLVAGGPMVRAYHLAETSDWLGLELEPEVASRAGRLNLRSKRGPPILVPWQIPTNIGAPRSSVAVNWPALLYDWNAIASSSPAGFYHVFFAPVGLSLTACTDSARRKYENAFAFATHALSL